MFFFSREYRETMGGGGGCVIVTISLKAYQKKVGDSVMSVDTDTNTYTFVSSHTIKCYNIEFAENDTLVIPEGANVILERTSLTIEEETKGIDRITVNGSLTLKEGSAITFGTITRGANGIVVNSLNGLVMEGGDITIDTIKDGINYDDEASVGILIVKDGSMIQKGGSINIETMEKLAYGIRAYQGGLFAQEGGLIKINTMTTENDDANFVAGVVAYQGGRIIQRQGKIHGVTVLGYDTTLVYVGSEGSFDGSSFIQEKDGLIQVDNVENAAGVSVYSSGTFTQNGGKIAISDVTSNNIDINYSAGVGIYNDSARFNQNGGQITISNVTTSGGGSYAVGMDVYSGGTFTQNGGQITISNVTGTGAIGVNLYNSATFTQNEGQITISNLTRDYVTGVNLSKSARFTQTGGQITISNVTGADAGGYAVGMDVSKSARFTQNGGQITISNVTTSGGGSDAFGVVVSSTAIFTQNGGTIEVSDVGDNAVGVYVTGTFNVKNLTVSGAEKSDNSIGFVSRVEDGVVNSGSVRVYDTEIKYSYNGTSETKPSPIKNTGGEGDNTFFTGKKYYDTKA